MRSKEKALTACKMLLPGLLIPLLFACAIRTSMSPGAWVEEKDRITLQDGGPHKGSWQTRDLTIDYAYREAPENLEISGTVTLADYIPKGFSRLDYLRIYLHFLTPDGVVLETQNIKYVGYLRSLDYLGTISFNTRLDQPEDAAAIAFSYSGRASEGGGGGPIMGNTSDGGQTFWDFWKSPRRSPPN